MVSIKLICVISALMIGVSFCINSCGVPGLENKMPETYLDCTGYDPEDATCCYVKYKENTTFCALIPGSYVKQKSIDDFREDIGKDLVQVNCNSRLFSVSYAIVILAFILIIF